MALSRLHGKESTREILRLSREDTSLTLSGLNLKLDWKAFAVRSVRSVQVQGRVTGITQLSGVERKPWSECSQYKADISDTKRCRSVKLFGGHGIHFWIYTFGTMTDTCSAACVSPQTLTD